MRKSRGGPCGREVPARGCEVGFEILAKCDVARKGLSLVSATKGGNEPSAALNLKLKSLKSMVDARNVRSGGRQLATVWARARGCPRPQLLARPPVQSIAITTG